MDASEFAFLFIRLSFISISVLTLIDLLRYRGRAQLDIALMFGAVTSVVVVLTSQPGSVPPWLNLLGSVSISAHPFLFLRLVNHFRPVPQAVYRASLLGLAAAAVILLGVQSPRPALLYLVALIYFALVEGYATLAFVRGALIARGVTRWRLSLVAAATGLLGIVVVIATVAVIAPLPPETEKLLAPAGSSLLALAAAAYYLGFAPPRWLRQAWQHYELRRFLVEKANLPLAARADALPARLCAAASRAVGALASVTAMRTEEDRTLALRASDGPLPATGTLELSEWTIARLSGERRPFVARAPAELGGAAGRMAAGVGAAAVLVVPVATAERLRGLLLVFVRYPPLFGDDDLGLLTLMADATAVTLEYAVLLDAQSATVEHLRRHAARNQALNEISQALVEAGLEARPALETVVRRIAETIGDACVIHLLADDGQWLDPVAYHHPNPEAVAQMGEMAATIRQRATEGLNGRVVQTGESVLVPIVPEDQIQAAFKPEYRPDLERFGARSVLHVPLRVHGFVIGALGVARDAPGRPYDEDDRIFLEAIANRTALAIENARLFEAVRKELDQRRQAEAALRETRDQLEIRVKERTAELEAANREIQTFASIVSHDLRAPLTNLKGFADELRVVFNVARGAFEQVLPHLDDEARRAVTGALQMDGPEALEFISAAVTRMDGLVGAILKLARLGHRELELELVNMGEVVCGTLQTLAHEIQERGVKVTVGDLPPLVADRMSVEQIVANLMHNAVVYLDDRRPGAIEIYGERGESETIFYVRDNGCGIAREEMRKVFEPFRRAGKHGVPGEGMGLAYVQTLVRRHGGRIWCESEVGVGTTFGFSVSHCLKSLASESLGAMEKAG